MKREWAISSEDILKRRTKLYLKFDALETQALDLYLQDLHLRRLQEDAA